MHYAYILYIKLHMMMMYKLVCKYVTGEKCHNVEDFGGMWRKSVKTWW